MFRIELSNGERYYAYDSNKLVEIIREKVISNKKINFITIKETTTGNTRSVLRKNIEDSYYRFDLVTMKELAESLAL